MYLWKNIYYGLCCWYFSARLCLLGRANPFRNHFFFLRHLGHHHWFGVSHILPSDGVAERILPFPCIRPRHVRWPLIWPCITRVRAIKFTTFPAVPAWAGVLAPGTYHPHCPWPAQWNNTFIWRSGFRRRLEQSGFWELVGRPRRQRTGSLLLWIRGQERGLCV